MPNLVFPLTFSLAPLPTGTALNANDFADQIVANLQATISGDFLTGQIGGNAPTTDIGPWANNGHWWFWDPGSSTYIQESLTSTFPTGCILTFGGIAAPTGFLLCDGTSYLRSSYTSLFAVIGTTYGSIDGSTFNVPDFRGRVPIGAGAGVGLSARSLGDKPGEEKHVLLSTELALHSHTAADSGHTHPGATAASHTHATGALSAGVQGSGAAFIYTAGGSGGPQPSVIIKT